MVDVSDPRLVNPIRGFVTAILFPYWVTVKSNDLFTVNHISIQTWVASTYFLGFLLAYLGLAFLRSNVDRRSIAAPGLEVGGWCCLVLLPSLLGIMIIVPWVTYGSPLLWTNFTNILSASLSTLLFGFMEVFIWDRRHVRRLPKFLPDRVKRLLRTPTPPYIQAWLWRMIYRFSLTGLT